MTYDQIIDTLVTATGRVLGVTHWDLDQLTDTELDTVVRHADELIDELVELIMAKKRVTSR